MLQRVDYNTLGEIEQILKKDVLFYNNTRLNWPLGPIRPMGKSKEDKDLILIEKLTAKLKIEI